MYELFRSPFRSSSSLIDSLTHQAMNRKYGLTRYADRKNKTPQKIGGRLNSISLYCKRSKKSDSNPQSLDTSHK